MKIQSLDIIAFGAHPDDVELGCGGTLSKLAQQDLEIGIVDLTEGEKGTRGTVEERYAEAKEAAQLLGVSERMNLQIPDGDIQNNAVNQAKIIALVRKFCPKIVFAPYPADRHPDHIHAGNLIREACFYAGVAKISPEDYPAHRPARIIYYMITDEFAPSFFVDISQQFTDKFAAIKAYKSQFYNPAYDAEETFISSKDYLESIELRGRYFGWKAGVKFAEPFWVKEPLVFEDLSILMKSRK